MRSTPVGIAMLNDEREHVWRRNNPENERVLRQWAEVIGRELKNRDGSAPEIVVGSQSAQPRRSVRSLQGQV